MDLLAVPLAAVMQQNLEMPTREPTQREKFWDCFAQDGWSGIQKNMETQHSQAADFSDYRPLAGDWESIILR